MQEIVLASKRATLGERLGGGSEGNVYGLEGDSSRAVKIYKPDKRQIRAEKIRAMVSANLGQETSFAAFPLEAAASLSGEFLGFSMHLMPRRRALHQLYNPRSRLHHYPEVDYRFVIRVAQNVARAVGALHSLKSKAAQGVKCLIGDLRPSSILLARDATVALAGTDSFQLTIDDKIYPCVAGASEFMPPELQAKRFENAFRTHAHDNFGLALAIFHLLFMGNHPYAERDAGPGSSLRDAIARGQFAYSATGKCDETAILKREALTLDVFPNSVSQNFKKAFGPVSSARPGADDWIAALGELEDSLRPCANAAAHYYPGSSPGCLWCSMKESDSFDMFPGPSDAKPKIPITAEANADRQGKVRHGSRDEDPIPLSNRDAEGSPDIPPEDAARNRRCTRCNEVNAQSALYCCSCGFPLDFKTDAIGEAGLPDKGNKPLDRFTSSIANLFYGIFALSILLLLFRAFLLEVQ